MRVGNRGSSMRISLAKAEVEIPKAAWSSMNSEPEAQACGRHATGYAAGESPQPRRSAQSTWQLQQKTPPPSSTAAGSVAFHVRITFAVAPTIFI